MTDLGIGIVGGGYMGKAHAVAMSAVGAVFNTKLRPKLSTTGGTSDARFLKNISPCLEFGLVGKTMHKIDEAVSLKDLKKLTKIYANILDNYFS